MASVLAGDPLVADIDDAAASRISGMERVLDRVVERVDGSSQCHFVTVASPETVSGQCADLDFHHPFGFTGCDVRRLAWSHSNDPASGAPFLVRAVARLSWPGPDDSPVDYGQSRRQQGNPNEVAGVQPFAQNRYAQQQGGDRHEQGHQH